MYVCMAVCLVSYNMARQLQIYHNVVLNKCLLLQNDKSHTYSQQYKNNKQQQYQKRIEL